MKNATLWNVITYATTRTWREVLLFAKQRVIEAGLPDHVVRMYLEQSTDRLTGRTRDIIKNALRSAQPATQPTTSTGLDETPALIGRQTKYSTLVTPRQRKVEAVKRKLDNELAIYHWIVQKKRMANKRRSGRLIMQEKHNLPIKKCARKPWTPRTM